MKKIIHILLFSSLIGSFSCVEDVLIEVEPAESKMVVSSLFIPDSIIIVTVTKSFSALSAKNLEGLENDLIQTLLVDRALVTIRHENETDTLIKLSPGVYIGALDRPNPLSYFELNIYDSATQQSVKSITQLKTQVRFDSVSVNHKIENSDTTSVLYYEFRDPAKEENWYLVQGFEFPRLPNFDNVNFDVENDEVILSPDTSNQVFFVPSANLLFTDLLSDISFENELISREKTLDFNPKDTVIFVLINIDEGYYDFLQARKRSGGFVASFLREPVNHPSNVEDGYGYFTMHLPHFKAFIRKEEN